MDEIPRFTVGGTDKERVLNFISTSEMFLDELVRGEYGEEFFYEELRRDIDLAWEEGRPHFIRLWKRANEINEGVLEEHGLVGQQLSLKLRAVEFFWRRFREIPLLTWLEKLLQAMNTTLKSIIAAAPGGTAAGEIKDILENCLKTDE